MSDTTIYSSGVFPDVQKQVRDRLAGFAEMQGIAMIVQYEGSIDSKIDEALAVMTEERKAGVALLIATPLLEESSRSGNSPSLLLDPFAVTVTVVEDTVFNEGDQGSGRRALEWAVIAWQILKGWKPSGCNKPLYGLGRTLTLGPSAGSRVLWNLSMQTSVGLPLLRHPGEYGYTD